MSNLTILNTTISQHDNLFNLKDLHRISGNEKKHEPYLFIRLDTTQTLVSAIQAEGTATPIKTLRGTQGGTYACKEIVIAYAAWISPQFHLVVLRAFLNQLENSQNNQQIAPLVEPKITMELTKKEWLCFASMWFALYNSLEVLATLEKPLRTIGSPFGATAYTHATEYQTTLGVMKRILEPILADFEVDPFEEAHYHKALTTLRQYQPKGLGGLVRI
ncbi:P22AR C-terminal domain-containing protein [Mannheimia haemolytica]|uniref:P22AR C-terminal domain-containing protein n=1 Tax=Mannheimia haemolytica TaxID=75985 RepID=UPI0013770924|nr:P22AR C-terminal domain-containing protein [Mannheimia haemolytica]NBB68516.1 bacteriocin [Mannheimia haemolytica]